MSGKGRAGKGRARGRDLWAPYAGAGDGPPPRGRNMSDARGGRRAALFTAGCRRPGKSRSQGPRGVASVGARKSAGATLTRVLGVRECFV